ncbi:MAG: ABC transporter permease, partial [Alphaproteobacteria bacterium]
MVFSAVERMIAFRYLRARRRETFISVIAWFSLLGIMLGVATLIVVMSVMNGFRIELVDRILGISGHIRIEEPGGLLQDADPLAASLLRQPEIRSAAPIIEGQVLAASSGRSQGAVVRGMRSADIAARGVLTDALVAGSLDSYDAGQGVLIGVRLARALGVTIGDRLTLVSPSGRAT